MSELTRLNLDGFCVFDNVISEAEVERGRNEINAIIESDFVSHVHNQHTRTQVVYKTLKYDPLNVEFTQRLFLNTDLLNRLKAVIKTDSLVYFGDSTLMLNEGQRGFHKDNIHANQNDEKSVDYNEDYDIVRLGIYLQDTRRFSGGIQFRRGSHGFAGRWRGSIVDAKADLGDVVLWKLTTTHSGNTLIPRVNFGVPLLPRLTSFLPRVLFRGYQHDRIAIFITLARLNSAYLADYLRDLQRRPYFKPFDQSCLSSWIVGELGNRGVEVIASR